MDSEKSLSFGLPLAGSSSTQYYNPHPATPRTGHFHQHPCRQNNTRSSRACNFLRIYGPIVSYVVTSLGFVVAIAFYRDELFAWLDQLASWLRTYKYDDAEDSWFFWIDGRWIMGALIFLTTIPPLPLYSTLIILSGYTFSWSTGAVISYISALIGAVLVFLVSRHFPPLHASIQSFLNATPHLRKAVRAIEKNNRLLFLIRLAPYPYNVMNCLLAASKVKLRTFISTTALSLVKVVIHTSVGASIHSFKSYHSAEGGGESEEEKQGRFLAKIWTILGIVLCIGILVYLSMVARRAVDDELGDDDALNDEERVVFLAPDEDDIEAMAESPFASRTPSYPPIR
ncbi:snare associated Golgi protein-domain-containing protein [Flagelloscypha sp. PMI_526]|nr:snare associated Golgi protein-domain-containing protein [Flagelloscypha sp. PMI_526]